MNPAYQSFLESNQERDYQEFLQAKAITVRPSGFEPQAITPQLFDFQRDIARLAIRKGKYNVFADCGLGKALASQTPVVTPSGPKAIGSLTKGDAVLGRNGKPAEVLGVYPQGTRAMFNVVFSDGSAIRVDGDHLWYVETQLQRYRGRPGRTVTTKGLGTMPLADRMGRSRFFIPLISAATEVNCARVTLDPYLLGALLGDGCLATGDGSAIEITSADEALVYSLTLPQGIRVVRRAADGTRTPTYRLSREVGCGSTRSELFVALETLGLLGLYSYQKFIPRSYKMASAANRLAILQGLMDTDGYATADGLAQFTSTSKRLAADIRDIIQSLGGTATLSAKRPVCVKPDGTRIHGRPAWTVTLRPPHGSCPFRLPRKAERYRIHTSYSPCRSIKAIEPSGVDDATCIAVDTADHLFVADQYIVTHNTPIQLVYGWNVAEHTGKSVLIAAPLAVSQQTKREGVKFGIPVTVCREQADLKPGVNITNYEMLANFIGGDLCGIVLDESSILKGDGPLRRRITAFASQMPYRLACTATPAPNDFMELGNHLEYLGIMTKPEMLATFFVHDGGDTAKWRLKKHAAGEYWKFLARCGVMIRKPSDLGYSDNSFTLPPLRYHQHMVAAEWSADYLFPVEAKTLRERQQARRDSLGARTRLCADLVNSSKEQWLVWCDLNDESKALAKLIPDAVEVTGSDSDKHKEETPMRFIDGDIRVVVTKSSIYGYGMNFQNCWNTACVGLSDSWESLYQLTRRVWRFGQTHEVHMHMITSELEGAVVRNLERKEQQAAEMADAMLGHMREINTQELHGTIRETEAYRPEKAMVKPAWL